MHDLLALTNFGLVRMLAGKIGCPFPEKFGLGMSKPCWRTQATKALMA